MLLPIKLHFPANVPAGTTRTVELDPLLPIKPILQPRLHFLNTSTTADFTITISQIFRLGPSDDTLYSANFTNDLEPIVLSAGQRTTVPLDTAGLDGNMDFCSITFTNNSINEEVLHTWLSGLIDERYYIPYPPHEI